MGAEEAKILLEENIKKWAGIDVQILQRFLLVPLEVDRHSFIVVFDMYKKNYLYNTEGKYRTFLISSEALDYLRGLYKEPLADDEEYDIIVKKIEKEVKDDEPEV